MFRLADCAMKNACAPFVGLYRRGINFRTVTAIVIGRATRNVADDEAQMKISALLFTFVCIVVLQPAHAQSTMDPNYFDSIVSQATPVADFVGKRPTTVDAVRKVRIDRDDQQRVTRIRNFENDTLVNLGPIGAAEVRIEYAGDKEIRTYWDANGNPDTVWRICYRGLNFATEGDVHKEVFTLGEGGRRIGLQLYDHRGRPTNTYFGANSYEWTWLDDDTVIEVRSGTEKNSVVPLTHFFDFTRTRISFDERGVHWLLENIDGDGNLVNGDASNVAVVRFEYNAALNEADYSFYDAQDRITERGQFGSLPHGYARITNIFSDSGRLVEETYKDRFNQLTNNSAGFARAVYDYDANAAFMGTRFVSVDGEKVEYERPY